MSKARKKTFSTDIAQMVEQPGQADGAFSDFKEMLKEVPTNGDNLIMEFLETTSDRTVKPDPMETATAVEAPEDDPKNYGEESGVSADYVRKVEAGLRTGKSLDEAKTIASRGDGPIPVNQAGFGEGGGVQDVEPAVYDSESGQLAAEELIEWYDTIQGVASVWFYDYLNSPKSALEVVEALQDKVVANNASNGERVAFTAALSRLKGYTGRKESFAETVGMNDSIKQRSIRLLNSIMEIRGITVSPELLLALLLLTPVVINGGRILIEKFGFAGGNELIEQFTGFVSKEESKYFDKKQ